MEANRNEKHSGGGKGSKKIFGSTKRELRERRELGRTYPLLRLKIEEGSIEILRKNSY